MPRLWLRPGGCAARLLAQGVEKARRVKYLAPVIAALAPLALALIEYQAARNAESETVEVARVLSEACLRTTEAR